MEYSLQTDKQIAERIVNRMQGTKLAEDKEDGVWRTIKGRKIFIKKGQSVKDAMTSSNKFKAGKSSTKQSSSTKNTPESFKYEGYHFKKNKDGSVTVTNVDGSKSENRSINNALKQRGFPISAIPKSTKNNSQFSRSNKEMLAHATQNKNVLKAYGEYKKNSAKSSAFHEAIMDQYPNVSSTPSIAEFENALEKNKG